MELWDLEEPTFVELYGTKNRLLKNISAPDGPGQDGNPAVLKLLTTHSAHDEDVVGRLWRSAAIHRVQGWQRLG